MAASGVAVRRCRKLQRMREDPPLRHRRTGRSGRVAVDEGARLYPSATGTSERSGFVALTTGARSLGLQLRDHRLPYGPERSEEQRNGECDWP